MIFFPSSQPPSFLASQLSVTIRVFSLSCFHRFAFFVIILSSSVISPQASVICPLSSVLCHLSSFFRSPLETIRHFALYIRLVDTYAFIAGEKYRHSQYGQEHDRMHNDRVGKG